MIHKIIQKLVNDKQHIRCVLNNTLTDNLSELIILNSITKNEIKNTICEEIFECIEKHPEKELNWSGISYNPNVTMEMIEKHPEMPLDRFGISLNPNITMEMIEKYPENKLSWYYRAVWFGDCYTLK